MTGIGKLPQSRPPRTSAVLHHLAYGGGAEQVSTGEIVIGPRHRVLGFTLFLFALSCCLPTPLGSLGEPEDIAGAALFLAAPAGKFVTGQTLVIDGDNTIGSGGYT